MAWLDSALTAHCILELPTAVIMLIRPAALFPHISDNEDATLMARGVGGLLLSLSILAWRLRGLAPGAPAVSAAVSSIWLYHTLSFLIVFGSKTALGVAGPLEVV